MDASPDVPAAALSVIMPIFNEHPTLSAVVEAVLGQPCVRELICVDDASSDGGRELLRRLSRGEGRLRVVLHDVNQGKGASLRTGIAHAAAPFTLFQDADLEYDPEEYPKLLAPLLDGTADVVYGSRFGPHADRTAGYRAQRLANAMLTGLSNGFTGLRLSDMETCYKAFRTELLRGLTLRENGFGIEPEITAKLARRGYRVREVPIRYRGRGFDEGKKIGWKDGLRAVACIARYSWRD